VFGANAVGVTFAGLYVLAGKYAAVVIITVFLVVIIAFNMASSECNACAFA